MGQASHDIQKPKIIEFEKLNKKTLLNNGTKYSTIIKTKKVKLDFKDSKYATGRRKDQ